MDLRSNYPYWLLQKGIIASYPSLQENTETDIAVIGGGISGALTAWQLQQEGFNVLVADRRHIGMGSTVASTALLQYEIDIPLRKLVTMRGEEAAIKSYQWCREAIDTIENICRAVHAKDVFTRHPSFQFASYKKDKMPLYEEFQWRKKAGFEINWLEEKEISEKFGFSRSAGLLSEDGASLNAYSLTHALLKYGIRRGMRVYDHTNIISVKYKRNGVELLTSDNKKIKARKMIIACGYESQRYLPFQVQQLHSTYVIASEPLPHHQQTWYENALIWETATPYLYLRTTTDKRIMVGGKDVPFSDPVKRDALLNKKAKDLERSFTGLFPQIPFKTDFKWAGSFASTKDGLPFIGAVKKLPHTYFALGLGGNGITFSVIAAGMIADLLKGRRNEASSIFSFDRLK